MHGYISEGVCKDVCEGVGEGVNMGNGDEDGSCSEFSSSFTSFGGVRESVFWDDGKDVNGDIGPVDMSSSSFCSSKSLSAALTNSLNIYVSCP